MKSKSNFICINVLKNQKEALHSTVRHTQNLFNTQEVREFSLEMHFLIDSILTLTQNSKKQGLLRIEKTSPLVPFYLKKLHITLKTGSLLTNDFRYSFQVLFFFFFLSFSAPRLFRFLEWPLKFFALPNSLLVIINDWNGFNIWFRTIYIIHIVIFMS